MRVQIRLPERAWEQLSDLACRERRYPKQQAEYLILLALGWETGTPVSIPDATQPAPTKTDRRPVREVGAP